MIIRSIIYSTHEIESCHAYDFNWPTVTIIIYKWLVNN